MTPDQPSGTFIDSFSNQYGAYSLYYNQATQQINVAYAGNNENFLLTEADRGRADGDLIRSINSTVNFGDVINFYAQLSAPFARTGTVTGNTSFQCDVVINSVTITGNAQTTAGTGSISISAESSQLPLQYSLDGVNWQSGNTFSSLPGGGGTAYVKDAAGCVAQQMYNIPTDTPAEPERLVSTPVLGQSRWSALFNPIVFGYQSPVHAPGRKFVTEITATYQGQTKVFSATHSANLTGYCRADISKYLRTLVQPIDNFDYSALNYRDSNISASYTIRYMEVWDDGQTDWFAIADPFYITYSAMQIGNKTGGNMQPYVTLPAAAQANPAKFLTDFKLPTFYTDMPFDLSFIYSELLNGLQINVQGNGVDVNGNPCGKFGDLTVQNANGTITVTSQQSPGALNPGVGVNRLRFNKNTNNIPANSCFLDIWLYYIDQAGNEIAITETKRLKLDSSPTNGLPYEYIKWMGPNGGWNYYMLIKNQIHEMTTSNAVLMERYIDDYATADSTQQLISITAQKKITAGKNDVPAAEAEALATILYSPKVYRLVDAASNTWQGVIIDTTSLKLYQTYGQLGDFEISYLLPEVNVQRA